jgi:hypothetical protein
MYCLSVIRSMNRPSSAPKVEDNFNRISSYAVSRGGIVLHSASRRSTCFLSLDKPGAPEFLAKLRRTHNPVNRSKLIESRF